MAADDEGLGYGGADGVYPAVRGVGGGGCCFGRDGRSWRGDERGNNLRAGFGGGLSLDGLLFGFGERESSVGRWL